MEFEYTGRGRGRHAPAAPSSAASSSTPPTKSRRVTLRQREQSITAIRAHTSSKGPMTGEMDSMDIDISAPSIATSSGDLANESMSLRGDIRCFSARASARTAYLSKMLAQTTTALNLVSNMQSSPAWPSSVEEVRPMQVQPRPYHPPSPTATLHPSPSTILQSASSASLASALMIEKHRRAVHAHASRPTSASPAQSHYISSDGNWEQRRSPLWQAAAAASSLERSGERMFSRLVAGSSHGSQVSSGLCHATELETACEYLMQKLTISVPNPAIEPCCICLNDMDEGDTVCLIKKCRHRLHHVCLRKWVKGKAQLTCPLCRS